ncbi:MAG TPA: thiamine diphosphokinase [Anaerolineales bacterium]|nr:thiamine diphosphokinase [Anaerolineales bacterium]
MIIAGGWLSQLDQARDLIQPDDLLIAADGGAEHFRALELLPHVLVGDLDSISSPTLAALEAAGVEILRYNPRKDYTDLELALHLAQERRCHPVLVFGAAGSRWDQTIAGALLPAAGKFQDLDVRLIDERQELRLLNGGEALEVNGHPGDIVSLLALSETAAGITTRGLEYPLNDEDLHLGATRGISNVLQGEHASIQLRKGLLLCIVLHGDPDSLGCPG